MYPLNNKYILDVATEAAISGARIVMDALGSTMIANHKGRTDLVTDIDRRSEQVIKSLLRKQFPDHDIVAEESGSELMESDYCWFIDPLDGTTNFVHNLPIFAVSMGLQYNEETILGVVYNPAVDKCFFAEKNGGAFLNGESIHTSSTNTLSDSLLVTGFPYIHDNKWAINFKLFRELYGKTQGIRRLGAASLDFCFVAMGRFEGFWEFGLQPWDVCAGALILKEAGGKVTDWDESPMPFSGKRVLATNGHIHREMINTLGRKLS